MDGRAGKARTEKIGCGNSVVKGDMESIEIHVLSDIKETIVISSPVLPKTF